MDGDRGVARRAAVAQHSAVLRDHLSDALGSLHRLRPSAEHEGMVRESEIAGAATVDRATRGRGGGVMQGGRGGGDCHEAAVRRAVWPPQIAGDADNVISAQPELPSPLDATTPRHAPRVRPPPPARSPSPGRHHPSSDCPTAFSFSFLPCVTSWRAGSRRAAASYPVSAFGMSPCHIDTRFAVSFELQSTRAVGHCAVGGATALGRSSNRTEG